jgi:hypothetical protein
MDELGNKMNADGEQDFWQSDTVGYCREYKNE